MQSDMQDVGVSDATCQSKINWTRLAMCQTDTDEPLQCSADSRRCGAGRDTNHLLKFCQSFRQLMVSRRMWTQLTDEGSWVPTIYCMCNAACAQCYVGCGTNHADCFSIPLTPNSLCQKVQDSVWSWKTFPLHCCS